MDLPTALTKYRCEVNEEINSVINGRSLPLYNMMRYHLGLTDEKGNPVAADGGKAIRSALCLFACETAGGDYRNALPAAAAIELVHNFTLIHDDIQDDDRERRHRPTVWAIWGKPQAINAGSAMHILAVSALYRLANNKIPAAKIIKLNNRLEAITLSVIEGQYLDIDYEDRFDLTEKDYLYMIEKKTGSLISGAMELGAMIGTDSEVYITGIRDVGLKLGLAFQIMDDLLGIWGETDRTGKPAGNDIRRRKKSFPFVNCLQNSRPAEREDLVRIYQKTELNDRDIQQILSIFEQHDVRKRGWNLVGEYSENALKSFSSLPVSSESKNSMMQITSFLTRRTY